MSLPWPQIKHPFLYLTRGYSAPEWLFDEFHVPACLEYKMTINLNLSVPFFLNLWVYDQVNVVFPAWFNRLIKPNFCLNVLLCYQRTQCIKWKHGVKVPIVRKPYIATAQGTDSGSKFPKLSIHRINCNKPHLEDNHTTHRTKSISCQYQAAMAWWIRAFFLWLFYEDLTNTHRNRFPKYEHTKKMSLHFFDYTIQSWSRFKTNVLLSMSVIVREYLTTYQDHMFCASVYMR